MSPRSAEAPVRALPQGEAAQHAIDTISEWFPECRVWFGRATGRCWAYVPTPQPRLVEAGSFRGLANAIAQARGLQ